MEKDIKSLIDNEELKLIDHFINLKRDIMSYVDRTIIVDAIREIIKESSVFEFKNKYAEKFIDSKRPVFLFFFKGEYIKQNNIVNSFKNDQVYTLVKEDIINKFSEFISYYLDKNEDIQKIIQLKLNDENHKNTFKKFLISNVFTVNVNMEQTNITLEYLV